MWKQADVQRAQVAKVYNDIESRGGEQIQIVSGGSRSDILLIVWYQPDAKPRK